MKDTKEFDDFYEQFDVESITLPKGENADMNWIKTSSSALGTMIGFKAKQLHELANTAYEKKDLLAMVVLIRSHLECTAAMGMIAIINHRLKEKEITIKDAFDQFVRMLLGTRRSELIETGAPQAQNILTSLEKVDKFLKKTLFKQEKEKPNILYESYGFLSEFAHPNFHSNIAGFDFDKASGEMRRISELSEKEESLFDHLGISSELMQFLHNETKD